MSDRHKVRPKKKGLYSFGDMSKAYILFTPEQRWKHARTEEGITIISRKNVTLEITDEEFEELFEEE